MRVLLWQTYRNFQKIITRTRNNIFCCGFQHISQLSEIFQIGSTLFWDPGPPVTLNGGKVDLNEEKIDLNGAEVNLNGAKVDLNGAKVESWLLKWWKSWLKGAGERGLKLISTFSLFPIEENVSYQELFSGWKNIVPSQSYRIFKSKNTYN